MADVEFFFDPVCPWAWITSRFVTEVTSQKDLQVDWRFISLWMLNGERDYESEFPEGYVSSHTRGLKLLRVAAAVKAEEGNTAVANLYTAFGNKIHIEKNATELDELKGVSEALKIAGINDSYASEMDNEARDKLLRDETDLVLTRAGNDVGTPVITFAPPDGPSFFGPVINRIPKGTEALELWDAIEKLAYFSGFAELKRSLRGSPDFS